MKKVREELSVWFWFNVVISLIPFIFSIWSLIDDKCNFLDSILDTLKNGELILLSAFLMAGLIGEMVKATTQSVLPKIWTIGPLAVCIILSSLKYEKISLATKKDMISIGFTSLTFFCIAIIFGVTVYIIICADKKHPQKGSTL
jgi:hypothetical protein